MSDRKPMRAGEWLRRDADGFRGPFAPEFRRLCDVAKAEHPSLLDVVECDDDILNLGDDNAALDMLGLSAWRQLTVETTDKLDFAADPWTIGRRVNADRSMIGDEAAFGDTLVITDGSSRRTLVRVRRSTGRKQDPETSYRIKIGVLLHELGHVADIEGDIHWHAETIDLVAAEVFAHHHACRAMVAGKYRTSLGDYLRGLADMLKSPSEYMRIAARTVVDSPEFPGYVSKVDWENRVALCSYLPEDRLS